MAASERVKGRRAEAEVAALYREHGFTVRGLESGGDHAVTGHGLLIHSEVKRQERLRLPLRTRQIVKDAPRGALPILAYRRNREPWFAAIPEKAVVRLLRDRHDWRSGIHYSLISCENEWWAVLALDRLLEGLAS